MKVCITGGLGYLGSKLTEKMLEKDFDVTILDSKIYGNFLPKEITNKVKIFNDNIKNLSPKGIDAIKNSDAVVHLAAIVGDPACDFIKQESVDINLNGTKNLIKLCRKYNKKIIYASTCSVYGANDKLLNEKSRTLPLSMYALSKYASENAFKRSKVDYTIFRMATLFGYSHRMRFDLSVNTFVKKAMTGNKVTVFGGNQWRPFLHIEDASRFYIKAIEDDVFPKRIFNLSGSNVKIIDLAKIAKEEFECDIDIMKELDDPRNYKVDSTAIMKKINLKFKMNIRKGMKEIKEAFENGKIKNPNLPIYSNLEYLRKMGGKI